MDAASAVARYKDELPSFLSAAEDVKPLLEEVCRRAGVLGVVEARAKDVVSYVKKAHLKASKYDDFWAEVTDKVGARIILGTRVDRDRALSCLVAAADLFPMIGEPDDKSAGVEPDELVYPGVHVQVTLPETVLSDGEGIQCEVQLRTKAEDLWSVPSHKLLYKPVVPAPLKAARRLWRLLTFVELFDEEVGRAMTEASGQPGWRAAQLLLVAEQEYYTFVGVAGAESLSLQVLAALLPAIGDEEVSTYRESLRQFVDDNREKLSEIYAEYGRGSAFDSHFEYLLFTQPESVIIFERIARSPTRLGSVALEGEFISALRPMYEVWGAQPP